MPEVRRLTGMVKAIAYALETGNEVAFTGSGANFLKNAYNVTLNFKRDEIDVTAYGDGPFKAFEAGFIDGSVSISMRHQIVDGALADDVEFMIDAALTGRLIRVALLDNRTSSSPGGYIFTMSVTSLSDSGDFSAAQNHDFELKVAAGSLPPKRIIAGQPTAFLS